MNADVIDLNPSLRSAQHAFDQWRSSRTGRERTPMALRECAVALLENHCAFHVCRALRINARALKQWSQSQPAPRINSSDSPVDAGSSAGFVRLPELEEAKVDPAPEMPGTLLIELPNEALIRVRRAFTLDELIQAAARVGGTTRIG